MPAVAQQAGFCGGGGSPRGCATALPTWQRAFPRQSKAMMPFVTESEGTLFSLPQSAGHTSQP